MAPHELIARLIKDTWPSPLKAAQAMHKASFQGTLHRYINGHSPKPTHATAKIIADYFDLPIEAIYEAKVASRIAAERGIVLAPKPASPPPMQVQEPAKVSTLGQPHKRRFSAETLTRIEHLNHSQFEALDKMVQTYLDTMVPRAALDKAHEG